jgi:hypothetical protein
MRQLPTFRPLSEREENEFRRWARENYSPSDEISELWHPVVGDECRRMREEIQTAAAVAREQSETAK